MYIVASDGKRTAFYELLERRLAELGITVTEFAKRAGISRNMPEKYKRGSYPHPDRLPAVARALELPLERVRVVVPVAVTVAGEPSVVPDGFDIYPSLSTWLEENANDLLKDEIQYLSRLRYDDGDPGADEPSYWDAEVNRYRRRKARRALQRAQQPTDIAANAPPLETGRALKKVKK